MIKLTSEDKKRIREEESWKRRQVLDGPPIDFSNKNLKSVEEISQLKVKAFEAALTKSDKTMAGPKGTSEDQMSIFL